MGYQPDSVPRVLTLDSAYKLQWNPPLVQLILSVVPLGYIQHLGPSDKPLALLSHVAKNHIFAMLTRAYVVAERGAPFELVDVRLDKLQPSEVLVEMLFTGVCHTVST
jgi:hypothetical protein